MGLRASKGEKRAPEGKAVKPLLREKGIRPKKNTPTIDGATRRGNDYYEKNDVESWGVSEGGDSWGKSLRSTMAGGKRCQGEGGWPSVSRDGVRAFQRRKEFCHEKGGALWQRHPKLSNLILGGLPQRGRQKAR